MADESPSIVWLATEPLLALPRRSRRTIMADFTTIKRHFSRKEIEQYQERATIMDGLAIEKTNTRSRYDSRPRQARALLLIRSRESGDMIPYEAENPHQLIDSLRRAADDLERFFSPTGGQCTSRISSSRR